ncbi:hypothetical protein VP01_4194g1 [Puccinia sorghi]|uniref:DDE Tnp4 domain-containing protein n=1 Tax=Puccinia sorghi TaxID=27349 RepID=A0A0L6UQS6_9BASI|nr:hypothetical protein VP01_4194g1 [Puccinia sorghi]
MFSQSSALDQTRSHIQQPISESSMRSVLRLKNLFQVECGKINLWNHGQHKRNNQNPSIDGNYYFDCKKRYSILLTLDHAMIAMYSQKCRFLSSLKFFLIKISSFWQTQCIKVISIHSQLLKGRNYLTIGMSILITILNSHDLCEMRAQIRNQKEMKVTIKWIISCIVLHNLLADLKDQLNELYEEDEPDSAPVVVDNIANSNDGICGILRSINLAQFEESQ